MLVPSPPIRREHGERHPPATPWRVAPGPSARACREQWSDVGQAAFPVPRTATPRGDDITTGASPPRAPPAHPPATEPPRLRQGWRRPSRTTSTRRTTQPTRPPPFPLPLQVHPPPTRQRGEAPRHFQRPPASARRRRGVGFAVPGSKVGTKAATAGGGTIDRGARGRGAENVAISAPPSLTASDMTSVAARLATAARPLPSASSAA